MVAEGFSFPAQLIVSDRPELRDPLAALIVTMPVRRKAADIAIDPERCRAVYVSLSVFAPADIGGRR